MDITPRSGSRSVTQIVIGLLVVAFGLLLTADNLGWVNAGHVLRYWPLALVAIGAARVLSCTSWSGRVGGGILMVIGGLLTADEFYHLPARVWDLWPVLLIAVGVLLVFRPRRDEVPDVGESPLNEFAFWSGVRRRLANPAFRRGDLTAVMGGVEVDLRASSTSSAPAVIHVFVLMGGIDIRVPPDWDVSNEAVAIMGGATDRTAATAAARSHLVIRGFVFMGGVDVHN